MAGPQQAIEIMSGEKGTPGTPVTRATVDPLDKAVHVQGFAGHEERIWREQMLVEAARTNELLLLLLEKF